MTWLLILVYSRNSEASSKKKTSAKSEYFVEIKVGALFATNAAIYALQKE